MCIRDRVHTAPKYIALCKYVYCKTQSQRRNPLFVPKITSLPIKDAGVLHNARTNMEIDVIRSKDLQSLDRVLKRKQTNVVEIIALRESFKANLIDEDQFKKEMQ